MIDLFPELSDTSDMLTPTKDVANQGATATTRPPAQKLAADLEFLAANQQLEGFSGVISAEAANHEPNMADIVAAARRSNPYRGKQGSRSDPSHLSSGRIFRLADFHARLSVDFVFRDKRDAHAPTRVDGQHPSELFPGQFAIIDPDDRQILVVGDLTAQIGILPILNLRGTQGHLNGDVLVLGGPFRLGAQHVVPEIDHLLVGHVSQFRPDGDVGHRDVRFRVMHLDGAAVADQAYLTQPHEVGLLAFHEREELKLVNGFQSIPSRESAGARGNLGGQWMAGLRASSFLQPNWRRVRRLGQPMLSHVVGEPKVYELASHEKHANPR